MISLQDFEPVELGLPEKFTHFRPAQIDAVEQILNSEKRFQALALPTGCVAGDTLITINRAGKGVTNTIEWFYKHRGDLRKHASIPSRIRSLLVDRFGLQTLTDERVTYSGFKVIRKLTLRDGTILRATPDHPILTTEGWKPLGDLTTFDHVICDRQPSRGSKKNYKQVQGLIFHPFAGGAGSFRARGNHIEGRLFRVAYHRLVAEARLNNITVETLILRCRMDATVLDTLQFLDPAVYTVHHADRDHRNNVPDNLVVMTHLEHKHEHAEENIRNFACPTPIPINSNQLSGKAHTFDAHCCAPYHNFVANGIVVHNSGKTLIAMAAARATGLRSVILTSTLGLMAQYERDFSEQSISIRGKANFDCEGSRRPTSCRFGHIDGCNLKKSCTYECQRLEAKRAPIVLTNYSYWLRTNKYSQGLVLTEAESRGEGPNPFGLLILDEAHEAMEELSRGLQVELRQGWLSRLKIPYKATDNIEYWSYFASEHMGLVDTHYKQAVLEYRQKPTDKNRTAARELEAFLEAVTEIAQVTSEHWVCEMRVGDSSFGRGRKWTFAPIWPALWAEQRLFLGIPKVVLMSATLRPTALRMLGVTKKEHYEFREWPRVFPAQYTPIYHIKNEDSVRMDSKADEERLQKWVRLIDSIISARLDRKGLIHTVSYARQEYLLKHSKHRELMIANTQDPDTPNASEVVDLFKASAAPRVLVSPSFSTGWDFPMGDCEYQIIAKVPFPDTRSKLMRARLDRSAVYGNYLTMQDLVQACGRGTRSEMDRCEIFIADSHIDWFFYRNRNLAPRWFDITKVSQIPPAPRKLAA